MISEKIRAMLSEQFGVDIERITDTTNIIEDLGADSLDVVELMMMIEEEFSVTIPEEKVWLLKTVGDVANYIEENA